MAKAVKPRMKFIVEVAVTVDDDEGATKKEVRERIETNFHYGRSLLPLGWSAKVRKVDLD